MTSSSENKINTPVLVGQALLDLVKSVEEQPGVAAHLAQNSFVGALRKQNGLTSFPMTLSIPFSQMAKPYNTRHTETTVPTLDPHARSVSPVFHSFWDYHEMYKSHKLTPSQVAARVIESAEASQEHEWIQPIDKQEILCQAAASTERYQNNKPKSQLDGVFMVFKEDQSILGRITTFGTSFLNEGNPATFDSTPIHRLREAGAIILGHSRMQEIGWDTFSINPNSGTPKNPYNLSMSAGGSSGGSSASVCGGLVPIALGSDSGGSIRIPSSWNGVYGLKPTAGRVSGYGGSPIDRSLGVVGPIATTVDDLALTFSIICGPDEKDPTTLMQPPFSLVDYYKTDTLKGMTIAVVPAWNKEVQVPAMVDHINMFVDHFKTLGATIVEIDIKNYEIAREAHSLTVSSEMNSFAQRFPDHHDDFLPYTRVMMALLNEAKASDYIRAQQVRSMMIEQMQDIFDKVDLIVTPVTGIQALNFPEKSLEYGMMDSASTSNCLKFTSLANFTGCPALNVPSGFADDKPVGVHFMAGWYNESLLLRVAKVCELMPGIERRKPKVSYSSSHLEPAVSI